MKILRLHLENFQGIREFDMEPNGGSCSIYGDNGSGKSTIYNAFTWLMYGKPSTGEKNYSPKTTGSHHLNHVVDMTVELENGSQMNLRKDYHETYKTTRGSANEVFSGHTTDYAIDGVPVNETQFKKTLANIYKDEELAKILTMPGYFLEDMSVKDRRRILLQVCGDVDFEQVIASDPELEDLQPGFLQKPGTTDDMYTVEEYQKIAQKKKTMVDKELKEIPNRIDEAQKAKPEAAMDEKGIREVIEDLKAQREELSSQKTGGVDAATAAVRKEIADLENRKAAGMADHAKAEAAKNGATNERIGNLMAKQSNLMKELMHMKQEQHEHQEEADKLAKKRAQLLLEWQAEASKEWTGSETCPTCGQPLPIGQIEKARAEFNAAKSQKLEDINQQGINSCSQTLIQQERDAAEALNEKITEKQQEIENCNKEIEQEQKNLQETTRYETTEEYQELAKQIAALNTKLTDTRSMVLAADAALTKQIAEIDKRIEAEQEKLANIRIIEQQDARIKQLEKMEKDLAAEYEALQRGIYLCELYTRRQAELLNEKINSRFETLKFRLFIEQQNGGIADDCEALVPCEGRGLVPFKSANNAARINAGLEVIDTLGEYYGTEMPVFIDNAESVVRIRPTNTQTIRLVVSEADKELRFETA